jgi:DNA-directed RNA polymerase specialized sigma24 family protein
VEIRRRFLTSLTSRAEAEDLTQETYLRAVRALPQFAGRSTVRTWLFAIARLSYQEAAEICGCPAGTIRSRIARARDDLVNAMRDQDEDRVG